jgi:hypothetical protein
MTDYDLWRAWWFSALYGASAETRMKTLDRARHG